MRPYRRASESGVALSLRSILSVEVHVPAELEVVLLHVDRARNPLCHEVTGGVLKVTQVKGFAVLGSEAEKERHTS